MVNQGVREQKEIIETILILINNLDEKRLNEAWQLISDLATEKYLKLTSRSLYFLREQVIIQPKVQE